MKVVIVGGVAGGASAAARIRRLDENAEIKIFERTGYVSYANCGLPYYVGGVITDFDELTLQSPEGFKTRFNVDVKVKHEVAAVRPEQKTVTVKNLETGECFEESYDKLILSPGAKATVPPFPGVDSDRIFTLRTVEDTVKVKKYIEEEHPESCVVAGGGFIGLEMAENLAGLGIEVTIVQMTSHLMNNVDKDIAALIHNRFKEAGVEVMNDSAVEGFQTVPGCVITQLEGGSGIPSDFVVMAIGVTPETTLAKEAGIECGLRGSIVVNDRMETSVPDIYAVGDAVEVVNRTTGKKDVISLAGPANKQGRIAADNICGRDSHFKGSAGSSVFKLFDMTVASTGITSDTADALGIDYDRLIVSPSSHADYYPGSETMTIKVLFEKDTLRILGAQIAGYAEVEKVIDIIATAQFAGLKVTDLKDLDLAYAPPYSSAKAAVNMIGFVAENIVTGVVKQFHWDELPRLMDKDVFLLDARTPEEYAEGHVPGFVNIPVDELRGRMNEIPKDKTLYIMCQSGIRSYIANRIMCQNGYDCFNFSGGYRFYNIVNNGYNGALAAFSCGKER
ncbi:MAG: FAD-dependent oxidoreductase [Eubacterium sp.]|nr:FAD-dependent oxidoreductase [Eubacterium sp.]